MYSNKENVNILTSLFVAHGIRHAVVCPGSRNAPIVHNLNECPHIVCHSVTDERSAGFYALGMAQQLEQPVVICVTSGSALLNVAPPVAEAFYRHVPLVVVSADRPQAWIDQQDGQTLPQHDALGRFVKQAVSLPEPADDEQRWYCNRLANEALITCRRHGGSPVHVNVPITEPMFKFDQPALLCERKITLEEAFAETCHCPAFENDFFSAKRPLIVVGQLSHSEACAVSHFVRFMRRHVAVAYECMSTGGNLSGNDPDLQPPLHLDLVFKRLSKEKKSHWPDLILYVGGMFVGKTLKDFLRQAHDSKTWIVNSEGTVYDTFKNLCGVVGARPVAMLRRLHTLTEKREQLHELHFDKTFHSLWTATTRAVSDKVQSLAFSYSQLSVVKHFFSLLPTPETYHIHAANSMPIRLVNLFAYDYVYCNRGVNGIEGSLSAAAGCSLVTPNTVYCIIGDLSFFYDQNALWHNLKPNLKVLLLNNGGGGIFASLPGLKESSAYRPLISARHKASAQGICMQNNAAYLSAHNEDELREQIDRFMHADFDRPVVFEVFTSQEQDEQAMRLYKQAEAPEPYSESRNT